MAPHTQKDKRAHSSVINIKRNENLFGISLGCCIAYYTATPARSGIYSARPTHNKRFGLNGLWRRLPSELTTGFITAAVLCVYAGLSGVSSFVGCVNDVSTFRDTYYRSAIKPNVKLITSQS